MRISQIPRLEDIATGASTLGVLYPVRNCFLRTAYTISHDVGYRVAYPGQGYARALMWDKRVEHPRLSFSLITNG